MAESVWVICQLLAVTVASLSLAVAEPVGGTAASEGAAAADGQGGDGKPSPATPADPSEGAGKVIKFPDLVVDLEAGRVEAKGKFCLREGLIEYLACVPGGKEYETLLRLECKPENLYLAVQALGLKPGKGVDFQGEQKTPRGDPVYLVVEWQDKGKTVRYRAEELVWNASEKQPMKLTHWVFVGSKFVRDEDSMRMVFMAAVEKNIAATFHDPYVLFDHPLETGADDTVYEAYTQVLPAVETVVKFVVMKGKPDR